MNNPQHRQRTLGRILLLAVSLCAPLFFLLLIPPAQAAEAPASGPFIDVPRDHWAYEAVEELRQRGILRGYPPVPERPAAAPAPAGSPARPTPRPRVQTRPSRRPSRHR